MSVLSYYELHRMAHPREVAGLVRLWEECRTMSITPDMAREAARIWAELRSDGYSIDMPDQFIAASARLHTVPIITYNVRALSLGSRAASDAPQRPGAGQLTSPCDHAPSCRAFATQPSPATQVALNDGGGDPQ